MRRRDKLDVGMVYISVLAVITALLTLMAAFAVNIVDVFSIIGITLVYIALNQFKENHRLIRVTMVMLLVLAGICFVFLIYEIVSAYNAVRGHKP